MVMRIAVGVDEVLRNQIAKRVTACQPTCASKRTRRSTS